MPDIDILNSLDHQSAVDAMQRCCGASRWATAMANARPFDDEAELYERAEAIWGEMEKSDILEAFSHHPQIGADLEELKKKFASTASWSSNEQAAVAEADEAVLIRLRDRNAEYLDRFGYIFIVCASGKSADEMLELLEERIDNDPDTELEIAAGEQAKITKLRLEKLEMDDE